MPARPVNSARGERTHLVCHEDVLVFQQPDPQKRQSMQRSPRSWQVKEADCIAGLPRLDADKAARRRSDAHSPRRDEAARR